MLFSCGEGLVFFCLFSQVCSEALMKTLELMSKLRQRVKDMETSFYRILQVLTSIIFHSLVFRFLLWHLLLPVCLQDQRMVTPLSLALTSHRRELVQTGLSLLFEASPLPDFPSPVWVTPCQPYFQLFAATDVFEPHRKRYLTVCLLIWASSSPLTVINPDVYIYMFSYSHFQFVEQFILQLFSDNFLETFFLLL